MLKTMGLTAIPSLVAFTVVLVSLRGRLAVSLELEEIRYPPVNDSDGRTPLYFSLIQSLTEGQLISGPSMVGLQLALDLINADETLLPGYSLHYVLTDASCTLIDALNAFHHQVFEEPTKIGIIGSGCSVSTEPTASISHYYNLVQVSCIASSPAFRNRNLFRRYFQLLPTDASLAIAYMGIIQYYDWRRVTIIVQNENLFTEAMDDLKVLLDANNVTYAEETLIINPDGIPDGYPNQTIENLSKDLFDEDSRIFIIHTYEPLAREIICEAYRQGYMYPRYVFFAIPWYVDGWWRPGNDSYGCTVEQREEVLEHSITLMNQPYARFLNGSQMETDTGNGLTVAEYYKREEDLKGKPPLNLSSFDDVAPVCYDAMWTFALALNNTIEEFERNISLSDMAHIAENMTERNQTFRIENFSYKNDVVMETMFKHLENTDFLGVSGNVTFNDLGIRQVTEYLILQFRRNSTGLLNSIVAGRWSENDSVIFEPGENNDTTWPMGIPYDGVSVIEEVVAVHVSITVILITLSFAGIIFSIVCLVFNFYYRNQTLIRLTSPNLNYLIGSGAIFLYVAIIVTVIPARSALFAGVLCNLRVWLTGFGLSLCYGTILVKMWRVYYIFSNPSAQKKANLHDWKLALMVLCFVVIDLVMLVGFSVVEGSKGKLGAVRVLDKEHKAITEGLQGRIRKYYVYICASMERDIFLGVFYGYKALLQICGLFLAFATRKVKVKGLDDAKWIAATIYITSIVLAIIILAVYTLNDLNNTHSAVFTGWIFIGTTFIMVFVFVPKMYALYMDPKGTKVFGKSGPSDPADKSSFENSERRVSESMQVDKKG